MSCRTTMWAYLQKHKRTSQFKSSGFGFENRGPPPNTPDNEAPTTKRRFRDSHPPNEQRIAVSHRGNGTTVRIQKVSPSPCRTLKTHTASLVTVSSCPPLQSVAAEMIKLFTKNSSPTSPGNNFLPNEKKTKLERKQSETNKRGGSRGVRKAGV